MYQLVLVFFKRSLVLKSGAGSGTYMALKQCLAEWSPDISAE